MSFAEISRQAMAVTRMRRNSVWDTIQFALNGIIFVLLGEQLPAILAGAKETVTLTGHSAPWWLGIYVIAIVAGLAALRFIWVWVSLRFTILRKRDKDSGLQSPDRSEEHKSELQSLMRISYAVISLKKKTNNNTKK